MSYRFLRRWLSEADPATQPIVLKVGRWTLWTVGAILQVLSLIIGFFFMFILAVIPDWIVGVRNALYATAGLFLILLVVSLAVVKLARMLGWKSKRRVITSAVSLAVSTPVVLAMIALAYGIARNEVDSSISLGHLALLPAVTMLLMRLTWRALGDRESGRATWLGARLLGLMGQHAATAEVATTRLVNPIFFGLLWLSLAMAAGLAFVHPVDATRHIHRALLWLCLALMLGHRQPSA